MGWLVAYAGRFRLGGEKEAVGVCRGRGDPLWIFNRSPLTINDLLLYAAKRDVRSYPAHGLSIWHNRASAAPAASFSPATRQLLFQQHYLSPSRCR